MYRYDEFDKEFVSARVGQFRDQVERRMAGDLSEDEFKPLRLMNGVYLQLHAYMLRVAIPYGTLDSRQMRMLGHIARKYDRGYGHFTTRQNIQYNWPKLLDIPDILDDLATVEMHAIQTSGNCIRNVTTDHFAGVAKDEIADPRVYAEILRQWSTLHPEFIFLPRKFKIAITGAAHDRAAIQVHDIGLQLVRNKDGEIGFSVYIGGGQGRTPMIAKQVREFLPEQDLIAYTEAILRVYNLYGRRDNKYKARIKILVHETGIDVLREDIEAEFERIRDGVLHLPKADIDAIDSYFAPPQYADLPDHAALLDEARRGDPGFDRWVTNNVDAHKVSGHSIVTISMKPAGGPPGDATDRQLEIMADLGEKFSHDELRISHEQNVILPHVETRNLREIYGILLAEGLAPANAGLITDIIACPGLDYCALANARSIPVAQELSEHFAKAEREQDIGELKIKISGCINACGHHHVGHIGILGVDRKGEEFYQITLGGSADENTAIGSIIGPGFASEDVVGAVDKIVDTYLDHRETRDESFLATYNRIGQQPFKDALYG
ncbi:MAG: nitrite/sulfite reductase [Pseudomonadota bacterium]